MDQPEQRYVRVMKVAIILALLMGCGAYGDSLVKCDGRQCEPACAPLVVPDPDFPPCSAHNDVGIDGVTDFECDEVGESNDGRTGCCVLDGGGGNGGIYRFYECVE